MSQTTAVPSEMVEAIADLKFPPTTDARLQWLMDQNNEGLLTTREREEFESLVDLGTSLSLLRAKALIALGRKPT